MTPFRHITLATILLVMTQGANSQPSDKKLTVTLFGNGGDCSQWLQRPNKTWLIAYLSGLNYGSMNASITNKDALKGLSPGQIYLWMDNYCKANPLEDVAVGAWALYVDLATKP